MIIGNLKRHIRKLDNGFTAVEIIIATFILSVVGVSIYALQNDIFAINRTISKSLEIQNEIRVTLRTVSMEIRSASPSSLGAHTIDNAGTSTFSFYANIDADSYKEKIRYFMDGKTLKRGVTKLTGNPLGYYPATEKISELIHDVRNGTSSVFSYFDSNYDGTSASLPYPLDKNVIRLVRVTVMINQSKNTNLTPVIFTTQVTMRNLKDNL